MIVEARHNRVGRALAGADPAAIRLHVPQRMRVIETTGPDGAKDYDVQISSAG